MSRDATPFDEGMGTTERMEDLQERAANFGNRIKDKATEFGSTVSEKMDRQRETAARGLDRAASSLHDGIGSAAKAGHGLADGMGSTASYIRSHTFGDMGNDVMGLARRYPVQSMISAAAIGFILGRALRR
jgi:hypothetical protein